MTTPASLLAQPHLRAFVLSRLCTALAMQIVSLAVGWQVYAATHSAWQLGLVGGVQFIPQLLLFPVAGIVVDRSDRRAILLLVATSFLAVSLALAGIAWANTGSTVPIFAVVIAAAVARVFAGPAAQATLPRLVSADELPQAASLSSTAFIVGTIVGPALGGQVYYLAGATSTYGLAAALLVAAIGATTMLPSVVAPQRGDPAGFDDMAAGMRFVWSHPILLAAVSLDLFAVLFGGAVALLPIFAAEILEGGPEMLGNLRAAPAVGAMLTSLFLVWRPIRGRVGLTLLVAVTGFAVATLAFAWSTTATAALVALFFTGVTDEISVFIRMNIVQLATPDHMRGRVSAAQFVFIGASNELGELESGVAAELLGPVNAVSFGGAASLLVVAVCAVSAPALRRLDRFEELDGRP